VMDSESLVIVCRKDLAAHQFQSAKDLILKVNKE